MTLGGCSASASSRRCSSAAGSPTTALGLLFDPTFPALTLFILVAAATIYVYRRTEQQRGEVRRAFGYYVAPAVVNEIIAHPEKLELGGVVRELTLLFCDVRNFTSISERMTAHELTTFINEPADAAVRHHPRPTAAPSTNTWATRSWRSGTRRSTIPTMPRNACQSALAMIARMDDAERRMAQARPRRRASPIPRSRIGIGINSGDCCVGNLGSVAALRLFGDRRRRQRRLAAGGHVEGLWRADRHRRIDGRTAFPA